MSGVWLEQRGIHYELVQEQTAKEVGLSVGGSVRVFDVAGGLGTAAFEMSILHESQRFADTTYNLEGFVGPFPVQLDHVKLPDTAILTASGVETGFNQGAKLTDLTAVRPAWSGRWPIPITADDVRLKFGSLVPVSITAEARRFLAGLPWPALGPILDGLRGWAEDVPLKAARATVVADPEGEDWHEVVLELLLDVDTETALDLWDDLDATLAASKEKLAPDQRSILDRCLAVHLLWGADSWNDQPTDDV